MNYIKHAPEDLSTITDPEYMLLTKIWRQVQSKSEGEGSAQTIDDILNMVDDEQIQDIFTDPDMQMYIDMSGDRFEIDKESFKADVQFYIQNKYKFVDGNKIRNKEVADSFLEEVKYQNVNEELLDNLITAINEAADKYTGC